MEPRWEYFKDRIIFKLKAGMEIWKAVEESCTEFNNWRPAGITAGITSHPKTPAARIIGYDVTLANADYIISFHYTGGITRDVKRHSIGIYSTEIGRLDNGSRWSKIEIE